MPLLRGYAVSWLRTFTDSAGQRVRYALDAIQPAHAYVRLITDHDENQPALARAMDRSLRMWRDFHGCAVEADLPDTALVERIVENWRRGRVTGLSVGPVQDPKGASISIAADGAMIVNYTRLSEISIVPRGACPEAVFWIEGEPDCLLNDEMRRARAHWHAGVLAQQIRARKPAQPIKSWAAKIPSSVIAAMQMLARNDPMRACFASDWQTHKAEMRRRAVLAGVKV
jgi:HK97 family phage prohead protease